MRYAERLRRFSACDVVSRFAIALPFLVLAVTTLERSDRHTRRRESTRLARPVPRAGRPADRRGAREHVRLGSPGGADRHDRPPAQRIAGARTRHPMGGRRNEARRPRERPHRARDGAEVGARQRERRDRRAGAASDGDARPRRQRRHAARTACRREVLVVHSFEELDAQGGRRRAARIVFFNVPFTTYGETVRFRSAGPSRAARHGAVASLVRSVGPPGLRTPHTGALQYAGDAPKIPAAAITDRGRRSPAAHGRPQAARSSSA